MFLLSPATGGNCRCQGHRDVTFTSLADSMADFVKAFDTGSSRFYMPPGWVPRWTAGRTDSDYTRSHIQSRRQLHGFHICGSSDIWELSESFPLWAVLLIPERNCGSSWTDSRSSRVFLPQFERPGIGGEWESAPPHSRHRFEMESDVTGTAFTY